LLLRFQSRATLPTGAVIDHASGVAQVAGSSKWNVLKLLYAGGWLARVVRRTAPYALSMASPRTIALARSDTRPVARIVGMLGQAEFARLRSLLHEGETASWLCCDTPSLSIGAIEVEVGEVGRIDALAEALGLQVLDQATHGLPLAATVQGRFEPTATSAVLPSDGLEAWDPRGWKWISNPGAAGAAGPAGSGTVFRNRGRQAFTYWVATPHGYWKTRSEAWAMIFHVAAQGEPIGVLEANGNCTFDRRLFHLPLSLVRWWLHWGGGCVAVNAAGQIVLCGGQGRVDWRGLAGWLPADGMKGRREAGPDLALARRGLALRKRLGDRRLGASPAIVG
jgi:hypothetical protein